MGTVVLMSGGIDSAVMCNLLRENGENPIPLFIDYGQLGVAREWKACKILCKNMGLSKPTMVNLKGYGKLLPSGLTDKRKDVYEDAFLPGRNMLFLLVASAFAYSKKHKIVAIGLLAPNQFPDQTQEFVVQANFALNNALAYDITIITPLIRFTKSQVIALAKDYKIPLDKTYSCHSGNKSYCGKCISCKELISSGKREEFPQLKKG